MKKMPTLSEHANEKEDKQFKIQILLGINKSDDCSFQM